MAPKTIGDVMTPNPHAVTPTATVREAAQSMREHDVGVLPVVADGDVRGVVTDRDIVCRVVASGDDVAATPVERAMTPERVTCREKTSIEEAAELMKKNQIRRLMVLDDAGKCVGIASLGDLATHGVGASGAVLQGVSQP